MARSGLPSPLKSPTATDEGPDPAWNGLPGAAAKPPDPFPSSTVTVPSPLAMARSGLPSPLKSPTATDMGFVPTVNGLPGAAVDWAHAAAASASRMISDRVPMAHPSFSQSINVEHSIPALVPPLTCTVPESDIDGVVPRPHPNDS